MRFARSAAFILGCLLLVMISLCASLVPVPLLAQSAEPTATPVYPSAVVAVGTLNVRSGPGTTFGKVGVATSGDVLAVSGKNSACTWIKVTNEEGAEGWVSANPRFVTLDTPCERIPLAAEATNAASAAVQASGAATPQPTPAATAVPELPKGKGCIDFGNWAGPEVIISGSLPGTNEGFDLKVKNKTVERICLWPGKWGVTISAIANGWGDLVLEIPVVEGEVIDFPLVRA